jgi:hypothetical protein
MMSNSHSNSPLQLGIQGSESSPAAASIPIPQPSYLRNAGLINSSASPTSSTNIQEDNRNDDGSTSSDLEEGEISERDLPAISKPKPIPSKSTRRFRQDPPRPVSRDITYDPNIEQLQRQYRPTMATPYYNRPTR